MYIFLLLTKGGSQMKVRFNNKSTNLFTKEKVYKVVSETRNTYVLYNDKGSKISISKSNFDKLKWFQSLFK